MSYTAPVKDMLFNIEHLARIDEIAKLPASRTPAWRRRRPCWRNAPASTSRCWRR
jgi:hypothetical protein